MNDDFSVTPTLDTLDSELETVEAIPEVAEDVTPEPVDDKQLQSALAQKAKYREKYEKAEAERKALEAKLNEAASGGTVPLAVEDFIDISTSLDGLDLREKAYLAEQHKLTGKPLSEIRGNEDFVLWQSAYRAKQEKENALKPNATQPLEEGPLSLRERLARATLAEKEEILREQGLYKEFRPRADRSSIGQLRSR